jgi:acetyltransferase-like isoleucine patch superfamily enzyme
MKPFKELSVFSFSGENWNIRILCRIFFMMLRGFKHYLLSAGKMQYPLFVAPGVSIVGGHRRIRTKPKLKIERNVILQTDAIKGIEFGSGCTIGEGTKIRPSGYYGGELGEGLRVGERSAIGVNSYIGCSGFIHIGDDVIIGPNFTAIAENHIFSDNAIPIKNQGVSRSEIRINSNVWIGCNVTILSGVTIGSGCVIAAGAVVTKSYPENSVIGGVPARLIRER